MLPPYPVSRITLAGLLLGATTAFAQQSHLPEVQVRGPKDASIGVADSASEGAVERESFQSRPKLRPGDILGALTGDAGIPGKQVGKIAIFDFQAFVAVERALAKQAMQRLNSGKIKGRSLKVRII